MMALGTVAAALGDGIIIAVILHHIIVLLYVVALCILLQFVQVLLAICNNFFFHQAVHAGIGFYVSTVYGLPPTTEHAFLYAKAQYFTEEFFKNFFAIQLPCTAEGAVPGKVFIQVVAQKVKNIQTHFGVVDNFAVAVQVF